MEKRILNYAEFAAKYDSQDGPVLNNSKEDVAELAKSADALNSEVPGQDEATNGADGLEIQIGTVELSTIGNDEPIEPEMSLEPIDDQPIEDPSSDISFDDDFSPEESEVEESLENSDSSGYPRGTLSRMCSISEIMLDVQDRKPEAFNSTINLEIEKAWKSLNYAYIKLMNSME